MDASLDMGTLEVERWTRTERRYTFQSKWALRMTLEARQEDGLVLCHLLLWTLLEFRTALRKALYPIPSIPPYLFYIECEDERNRNRRIHCDDGGCNRLEPVPEPGHGDDDELSKNKNGILMWPLFEMYSPDDIEMDLMITW